MTKRTKLALIVNALLGLSIVNFRAKGGIILGFKRFAIPVLKGTVVLGGLATPAFSGASTRYHFHYGVVITLMFIAMMAARPVHAEPLTSCQGATGETITWYPDQIERPEHDPRINARPSWDTNESGAGFATPKCAGASGSSGSGPSGPVFMPDVPQNVAVLSSLDGWRDTWEEMATGNTIKQKVVPGQIVSLKLNPTTSARLKTAMTGDLGKATRCMVLSYSPGDMTPIDGAPQCQGVGFEIARVDLHLRPAGGENTSMACNVDTGRTVYLNVQNAMCGSDMDTCGEPAGCPFFWALDSVPIGMESAVFPDLK